MSTVELNVNGDKRCVEAYADARLLYILRNDFDCKGVRFGCGTGHCGACTVLLDGRAVQSCETPLSAADGHQVTTVESLAGDRVGMVVREAFLQEQAAQCGYCINGILMSATALLRQSPQPSAAEMREMLRRHLCRCGVHQRIARAVRSAAARLRNGATE